MGNEAFTLLVVDDEELNRDMLARRLEMKEYKVLAAADGYAALGMVESEPIDLVLLDIMMPGIDGMKVLRKLREKHSEAELPIIMASAVEDSETIVESLSAGANDYVTKPLDFPIVLARIEAQLRKKQSAPPNLDPDPSEIEPGSVLGGRYELVNLIGQGGFGVVYRARHLELEFDLAVKLLHGSMMREPTILERFRREGISTCRVQHPNAVSIYDFQVTPTGIAYLVMEFLHGRSLADYLESRPPLSPEECAEILVPVCDALDAAHAAGVVHRDIKPENLFLQQVGGRQIPKVLDFGIAEFIDDADTQKLTQTGMVVGSSNYMAPERILGESVGRSSDVFSLGVLLYRMLSGTEAFSGKSFQERHNMHLRGELPALDADVPEAVKQVVASALSGRPEDRPDAAGFAESLLAAVEGRTLSKVGPTRPVSGQKTEALDTADTLIVARDDDVGAE